MYDVGRYICVDVSARSSSTVLFTLWSRIPQPVSYINSVAFDVGKHTSLFADMAVLTQSAEGTIIKRPPSDASYRSHAYLPRFTPDFAFRKEGTTLYHPGGINPGDMLMITGTLAPGKSVSDVLSAMSQGGNPATEVDGLRIGVIVYHLKGKRRNANVTEGDDAGFVTNTISNRCQAP